MLLLLIGSIASDRQWIVCRVARPAHDTTSIIHQAVLSKEMHPPADFSRAIFSLPSSSLIPPPPPPSLALCAGALRASCRCLSLVLTYEFIKRVSAARAGGFGAALRAKMGGDSSLRISGRAPCGLLALKQQGWTCLPFPLCLQRRSATCSANACASMKRHSKTPASKIFAALYATRATFDTGCTAPYTPPPFECSRPGCVQSPPPN